MSDGRPSGVPPVAPAGVAGQQDPVRTTFLITYPLALIGLWTVLMTPAMVTLPLAVQRIDPDAKTAAYGLVAGLGGIVAVIANPLFGRLSDRTRSRWGRRLPWIVVGAAGAVAGSLLLAVAADVATLAAGWVVLQLLCNAAVAALLGVLADRVPLTQRGLVAGLAGLSFPGGLLLGTYLAQLSTGDTAVQFGAPAVTGVVLMAPFVLTYHDRTTPPPAARVTPRDFLGSFWSDPRRNPDLTRMLAASFLVWVGMAVYQSYNVFFLSDHLGIDDDHIARFSFYSLLVSNLVAIIMAPLTGLVTDRLRRRKPVFAIAATLIGAGLVVMLLGGLTEFLIGAAIAGVGFGAFKGTYLSMTTDTLTDPTTPARDLGLLNIAITLPGILVPVIAPAVLAVGGAGDNYVLLFSLGSVAALAAMVPALQVRCVR